MNAYLLVFFCVASLTAGQVMFKLVSNRLTSFDALFVDWPALAIMAAALSLYATSTVAWVLALRTLPLSQAYLFMSLGFVAVPVLAHFIFGERLGPFHLAGTVLVVAGLVLATR
jgi:drug/metabolite transporter (DMT)-like permease